MKVSMADVNKKGNAIINQVVESGEVAVILKHGKPIAEIRPIVQERAKNEAVAYLTAIEPVKVKKSLDQVIETGRRRGV
jgi:antitoxin (DNA-binding transcriptional repressor) of toxin-antitoxin stability system